MYIKDNVNFGDMITDNFPIIILYFGSIFSDCMFKVGLGLRISNLIELRVDGILLVGFGSVCNLVLNKIRRAENFIYDLGKIVKSNVYLLVFTVTLSLTNLNNFC